ncbi:DUF2569 family protein [Oceanobacillus neutriphilus]|uniref:DUF2569 domain-containing protein n=1 Tax=Oceanobacillus neutriphilus TaxID=531815 RepID=A0ABQ2NXW3_9BACI|nr:DUF2569 family protein [Oceanobacillus neutriphilus]GGP13264.1 hypothetical protein GCM10011346_32660 [Oceanobacillus neutriphilus]
MEEKNAENQPEFRTDSPYAIVAGWLILPAIMMILNIVVAVYIVIAVNPAYLGNYDLAIYITNIILIFFYLFIIYSWIKRKRILPKLMITAYTINILSHLPDLFMEGETGGGSILPSVLWILYFIRSRRVKATFTN